VLPGKKSMLPQAVKARRLTLPIRIEELGEIPNQQVGAQRDPCIEITGFNDDCLAPGPEEVETEAVRLWAEGGAMGLD
jgi:hypothetical protein